MEIPLGGSLVIWQFEQKQPTTSIRPLLLNKCMRRKRGKWHLFKCSSLFRFYLANRMTNKQQPQQAAQSKYRLTTPGRSQQVSCVAHVVLQTISKDWRANCGWKQRAAWGHQSCVTRRSDGRHGGQATDAEPLLGPRVFTSLPSISKPSVGKVPRGRAGLSPTCWQSTERETLTWLTDRWTWASQKKE